MNIAKRIGQIFLGFTVSYFLADSIIRLVDEIKAQQLEKELDKIREEKKAEKENEETKEKEDKEKVEKIYNKYNGIINTASLHNPSGIYTSIADYREDVKDIEATQAELFEYFGELDQRLKKIEDICNLISFNYSNHSEV